MRRDLVIDVVLVILAFAVIAWLNVEWARLNQAPPRSDDNSHLTVALELRRVATDPSIPTYGPAGVLLYPGHYPPLVYQVTLAFFQVLGVSYATAIASLQPFVLLFMLSMYGIGRVIGGRAVGLACAVMAASSPAVLELSRTYFLDMPAAALVAACLCSLLYSDNFRHRGWALAFGVAMGLGMLTKWVHVGFLVPFLLWPLVKVLWNASRHRWLGFLIVTVIALPLYHLAHAAALRPAPVRFDKISFGFGGFLLASGVAITVLLLTRWMARRRLTDGNLAFLNFLDASTLALILVWPWYSYNAPLVLDKVLYQGAVDVIREDMFRRNLFDGSALLYLCPYLFLLGTAVGLWRNETCRNTCLLLASIAVILAALTGLPADTRYLLPILVFLAPLCVLWLPPLGRWAVVPLLVLSLVGAFQAACFLIPASVDLATVRGPHHRESLSTSVQPVYMSWRPVMPDPPDLRPYPYEELLRTLHLDPQRRTSVAIVVQPDDGVVLQPRSFAYYGQLHGYDLGVVEPLECLKSGGRSDVFLCDQLVLIYRLPQQREDLLQMVWAQGWFDHTLLTTATLQFPPNFQVEVLTLPQKKPH